MSNSVIAVERLSKRYFITHERNGRDGFRHAVERAIRNPVSWLANQRRAKQEEFWALKDVSFEVERGEVVGIIGRNGAGKSTLLRILSRITEPTNGRVRLKGRVASLLEVGTGFHPELTGRENIFLNGAILGMTKAEIKRRFDEIVAFSEIEEFLDTPVKRYSSGMYVRLAFAVAAHLEPEILIVDEVLAVGDVEFQAKCLGKMQEVSRQGGRTVLFVSHNMQAVSTLTTRSVLLSGGNCQLVGDTSQVVASYLQAGASKSPVYSAPANGTTPRITHAEISTSAPGNTHVHGEPIRLEFCLDNPSERLNLAFSFQIVDWLARPVVHLGVYDSPQLRVAGRHQLLCEIPNLRLYMGRYTVTFHVAERKGGIHHQTVEGVCPFEVVMHGLSRAWGWESGSCVYIEDCRWVIQGSRLE